MWNFRESPLIDGDKVICTPGASSAMLVALDKTNGEVIWKVTAPASATPANSAAGTGRPNEGERGPQGGQPRGNNAPQAAAITHLSTASNTMEFGSMFK
jgi:outer membrane protein assembly factor BamB